MRDGVALKANIFRPRDAGRYPAVMTLGPYPKDIHFADWDRVGFYEQLEEHGPRMHRETSTPSGSWCGPSRANAERPRGRWAVLTAI